VKPRHVAAYRTDARAILESCRVPIGADFHTLTSAQVDALLTVADQRRYQKPRNANGSRGRYFHAMLQRRASREES
jgi:hypothetical protein